METNPSTRITVQAVVKAPLEKTWTYWVEPEHIARWSYAPGEWHEPTVSNDLRTGGKLVVRMKAKDGGEGFDFGGVFDVVKAHEEVAFTMEDGRRFDIAFTARGDETAITMTFSAESAYPVELQQAGWQSILDNFKRYAELH